ncbi:hypothetical protein EON65_20870 [archaeon]|nr:MAG: hypothetical protein EON65_20870 [archaeon]
MRPVLIALQSEVTSMQSLVLRTWKPQAMERTVQDTAIILKGKLLCSTLFKEFELKEQLTSLLSQKAPGQQSAQPQLRTTYLRSLQHQQQYRQNHQRPQSEQLKERELPQQNMMSRSDSGASLLSLSSVASSGNIEHSDLSESQQSKHLHGSYPSLKQDAGLSSPVIGVIDDMSGSIDESENMEAAEDAGYGNIELLDQEDGRTGSTLSSFESRQEDEQGYEEVVALGTNEKSLPDDWLAQHMRNGDQLDADEPMAFSSPDAELVDDGRGYYGEDIMDTSSSDASICQQSDEEDESGLDNFIVKDDKEVNMG